MKSNKEEVMKKYTIHILLLLIISVMCVTSCDLNDDENLPDPTYNVPVIGIEDNSTLELFVGQSILYPNISLSGSVGLVNFKVLVDGTEELNENYDGTEGAINSSFQFVVPSDWLDTTRTLTFELRDRLDQVTTVNVNVVVGTVTPEYTIEEVEINGQAFKRITGNINLNETLDNSSLWIIKDTVSVAQQIKLTITEGTQIFAENEATILRVLEFGEVDWQGTATNPIVFNSLANAPEQGAGNDSPGQWNGIRIDGSGSGSNVGTIRYIRQMYAGSDLNAFQFDGVGNGTIAEYIQVYRNANRGFRIDGSDVNLKYLVSTNGDGTGIRMDDGWSGNGQFWVIAKNIPAGNALEGRDGTPVLSNITITGQGLNNPSAGIDGNGIRIRDGGNAQIYKAVVTGVNRSLRYSGGSEQGIAQGESFFRDSASFNNSDDDGTGFHSSANFFNPTNEDYEAVFNNTVDPFDIVDSYVGVGTLNLANAQPLTDPFFDTADYIGAVEAGNDWTIGWCLDLDGTLRQ